MIAAQGKRRGAMKRHDGYNRGVKVPTDSTVGSKCWPVSNQTHPSCYCWDTCKSKTLTNTHPICIYNIYIYCILFKFLLRCYLTDIVFYLHLIFPFFIYYIAHSVTSGQYQTVSLFEVTVSLSCFSVNSIFFSSSTTPVVDHSWSSVTHLCC